LPEPEKKKHRFWEFDPATFQPLRRAGLFERRLRPFFRSAGKYLLYSLAFLYPFLLVTVGIIFGGIAFWTSFAGSFAVIGLLISRLGYAKNFANWDLSLRKFGALVLAFLAAFGFYEGLINLRIWVIPLFAAVLSLGLAYFLIKNRV
jgi:hypothetical protein